MTLGEEVRGEGADIGAREKGGEMRGALNPPPAPPVEVLVKKGPEMLAPDDDTGEVTGEVWISDWSWGLPAVIILGVIIMKCDY